MTPVPVAPRPATEANNAPAAPPIHPITNGFPKRRFTPKIAGSVIPIHALNADGTAIDLIFWSFDFMATASAAPPWAIFAADASGSQYVIPNLEICPRSIMVYM